MNIECRKVMNICFDFRKVVNIEFGIEITILLLRYQYKIYVMFVVRYQFFYIYPG